MTLKFRDALGIFWYDRYKAVAEAAINLVCSFVLTKIYGIIGIFVGTTLCNVCVNLWVEPYILYKYGFHKSSKEYYMDYTLYTLFTVSVAAILYVMNQMLVDTGVIHFCIKTGLTVLIYIVMFMVLFFRNIQFRKLLDILNGMIKRRGKNIC